MGFSRIYYVLPSSEQRNVHFWIVKELNCCPNYTKGLTLIFVFRIYASFAGMIFEGINNARNSIEHQPRQNYAFDVWLFEIRYLNFRPLSVCNALNYPPKNVAQLLVQNWGFLN